MNSPETSRLPAALDQAEAAIAGDEYEEREALVRLIDTVRDELGKADPAEAERMAAEAEHAARRTAPPVPDITVTGNWTIRAVLPGHPAGDGLLESWWVAGEDPERGEWVTWEAHRMDGRQAGYLAYNAGYYFNARDVAGNRREALADLAIRAGLTRDVALRIADEITRYEHGTRPAARRAASYLHRWAGR